VRLIHRLLRLFQQDRIRVSAEEHALLRLGCGALVRIRAEEFVVLSAGSVRAGLKEYLVYRLAPAAAAAREGDARRLFVPVATPDRAFLLEPGMRRPAPIPASRITAFETEP
jgi:hypothetical protein